MIREKIPLFILSAGSCALTYAAQKQGGVVKSVDIIPMSERITNAIAAYAAYIGKTFYPLNLSCLYIHPGMRPWWKILGAAILLILITFWVIKMIKRLPYLAVGWFCYLGTLVPVIGLVQVGMQSMADRYTYVPLIGLFIMLAWGVPDLLRAFRHREKCLAALAATSLIAIIPITWKQAGYWKNSITVLTHAIEINPANYIAHDTLGAALFSKGRVREAKRHYSS